MRDHMLSRALLDLFDGEAAGPETGDGSTVQGTNGAEAGQGPAAVETAAAGGDGSAIDDSGAQSSAAAGDKRARRRAFRELVIGEFKDIYTEETQRIINSRFKETRMLQEQLERQRPLLELLGEKYAVPAGDVDKLTRAVREEKGSQPPRQGAAAEEAVRRQAGAWMDQCRALADKYPGFDLGRELADPGFGALLRGGASVEQAYRTLHFDQLMRAAAAQAAAGAEKRVADHIRARGRRPEENGIAAQSGFVARDDPTRLSREDFEDIARRVARGERIEF